MNRHDLKKLLSEMTPEPWTIEEESYGPGKTLYELVTPGRDCAGEIWSKADAIGVVALRNHCGRLLELLEEARGAIARVAVKRCGCEDRCNGPDPNPGWVCDWHRFLAHIDNALNKGEK